MAYESGGLLKFVNPDLSTRLGAQSAMDSAKFCLLIVAGFRILAYVIATVSGGASWGMASPSDIPVTLLAATVLIDIALPLFAAWRLHIYKGAFVLPITTLLYVVGILMAPDIRAIVIAALFTAVFVGGIRGAWALRGNTQFEDDHVATFS
jgi:hypothetical protein